MGAPVAAELRQRESKSVRISFPLWRIFSVRWNLFAPVALAQDGVGPARCPLAWACASVHYVSVANQNARALMLARFPPFLPGIPRAAPHRAALALAARSPRGLPAPVPPPHARAV